jgi:dTMP kinase
MTFFVIEGIDGSGKSTQVKKLMKFFENKHIKYKYLHFPRTDSPVFGEMIARFLRGDFGSINSVDPYLVALLYAGDRFDAAPMIQQWIKEGTIVILDRYVYSNIAFQCAKIADADKRRQLKDWILHLEFDYYNIPRPDLSLFLDVPFEFTRNNLTGPRKGDDREYLMGMKDIHEEDMTFQQTVREMYLWQVKENNDFKRINCVNENGGMKSPDEIFADIKQNLDLKT